MSEQTPRTALPLLAAAQAQKHVTHNEALLQLDALLFARILDRDLTAPPSAPADGDTYLVHATATGDWTGEDGRIAYAVDGAWRFTTPFTGLAAYVVDESVLIVFTGSAWVDYASILNFQNVPLLGVNTTADATNRLAVKSSAVLFDNIGTGVQAKLNKTASGDTASVLYQAGYAGRAEIGLCGDDDFHFKVSPDGSSWSEALKLVASGGQAQLLAGSAAAPALAFGGGNDGWYRPASHALGLSLNGTEVVRATATAWSFGVNGTTNPALTIDASAASCATGIDLKGAAAGGGATLSVLSSGANENLALDAKGSGTITLGGASSGAIVHARATSFAAAITYGGVTLSNAVTGTGAMALATAPSFTTPTLGVASATSLAVTGGSAPANGLWSSGTNILDFATASTRAMQILANGHVLVGTTTDSQTLTVGGNIGCREAVSATTSYSVAAGTTATIASQVVGGSSAGLCVVIGGGAGGEFVDLVAFRWFGSAAAVSQTTTMGSPPTRSYSIDGSTGALKLTLGSGVGTYAIYTPFLGKLG